MGKKEYEEQLKSPEWQKKRLEIMNFDGFRCQMCGCNDRTLHVHHLVYDNDCKIHEYGFTGLITLCEDCHNKEHGEHKKHFDETLEMLKRKGFTWKELYILLDSIAYCSECGPKNIIKYLMKLSGAYDSNKRNDDLEEMLDDLCYRRSRAEDAEIDEYFEKRKEQDKNNQDNNMPF